MFKFSSSVLYNDNIYYIPFHNPDLVILNLSNHKLQYIELPSYREYQYSGGIYNNGILYLIPYINTVQDLLIYDTTSQKFTTISLLSYITKKFPFNGGICYNDILYITPYDEDNIITYNTNTQELNKIQINIQGTSKYETSILHKNVIYYIPLNADEIGIYNIPNKKFTTTSLSFLSRGKLKFSGATLYQDIIYMVPTTQNIMLLLDIVDSLKIKTIELGDYIGLNWKGCVGNNGMLYIGPYDGGRIGVVKLKNNSNEMGNVVRSTVKKLEDKKLWTSDVKESVVGSAVKMLEDKKLWTSDVNESFVGSAVKKLEDK